MFKVLLLVSAINMSDMGQAEQLLSEFKQLSLPESVEYNYVLMDQDQNKDEVVNTLYNKISPDKCTIIFSVGYRALDVINQFNKDPRYNNVKNNLYLFWGGQQYFEQLGNVENLNIDYILLPSFMNRTSDLKSLKKKVTNVSTIFGVATKVPNKYDLEQKYNNWNALGCGFGQKPVLNKKYIIVSLPGDIEEGKRKINKFTKQSSDELLKRIIALWHETGGEAELLIQNSPRTGKFDENNKLCCNHEFKSGELPPMDHITEHFVKGVRMNRLPHRLFNFGFEVQKGKRKQPCSVADALLYVATNTDSYYVISGESLSYISQLTQILSPEKILVYESSSMNDLHKKLLKDALKKGYLSILGEHGKIVKPEKYVKRGADSLRRIVEKIIDYARNRCFMTKVPERCESN